MKKLILIISLTLIAFCNAYSLEPVRVAIVTSSANLTVDVELYDYSTSSSLYIESLGSLSANSSGIISFIISGTNWTNVPASSVNSSVVLNVKTGGTLYAQYRVDQLMIVQAQSGSGEVTEPASAGKLIDISATNVISKMNNLQVVTMSANVTVDADNSPEGIFRFDMSGNNTFTIANFNNAVDGGVYTFHFVGAATGGAVTFPASFVKEDGTALGIVPVTTSKMVTFYHYTSVNHTTEQ
ncbi:MAG: hypothetical protein CVV25_13970 [Ignavibacteriae bacterium HGW-Ignavibacteriae-4]|nr:MAG: hypothetical protein CVV25_13970 [Ignavibacteriae bacterium HGW-Ignavibacteriae-4]